jgi:hypothetical protein
MFRFRALVHDVEPAGARTRVLVDVIHGAIAAGDTVELVGPCQVVTAARRVDDVVPREPEASLIGDDRPPAPGSQLYFTVADLDPSQIWKRGMVRADGDGPDRPILSPWAAVFEQLIDEHEMLALADLARGEARLLANGEPMHHFLGHDGSERGVAQALVERLVALRGDGAERVSSVDFVGASARGERSTPQQRAELVARLAVHGVELGFAPIR